jgi:hypothetical protein
VLKWGSETAHKGSDLQDNILSIILSSLLSKYMYSFFYETYCRCTVIFGGVLVNSSAFEV